MKKLGRTQQAVFDHIQRFGPMTAAEVGEALYTKISACANWKAWTPPKKLHRQWASKVLSILCAKGVVAKDSSNPPRYHLTGIRFKLKSVPEDWSS